MFTKILCLALLGLAFVQPGSSTGGPTSLQQEPDAPAEALPVPEYPGPNGGAEDNHRVPEQEVQTETSLVGSIFNTIIAIMLLPITIPYRILRSMLHVININIP